MSVAAEGEGVLFIEGRRAGELPQQVGDLAPGTYHVRVELVDGTIEEDDVNVMAGGVERVFVKIHPKAAAGRAHAGAHFGFEVGGGGWLADFEDAGAGGLGGAFVNFGLSPTIDLRAGGRLMAGPVDNLNLVVLAGPAASVRFNVTSLYTIALGAVTGIRSAKPEDETWSCQNGPCGYTTNRKSDVGLFLAPEVSFATFRLGSHHQFELALTHGLALVVTKSADVGSNDLTVFYHNASFSMLVL